MYENTARRPQGVTIITDPACSAPVERDTLQCVHCDCHFEVQPGSGRTRGFCTKCMGPTCGHEGCHACAPFERKLEMLEKGLSTTL